MIHFKCSQSGCLCSFLSILSLYVIPNAEEMWLFYHWGDDFGCNTQDFVVFLYLVFLGLWTLNYSRFGQIVFQSPRFTIRIWIFSVLSSFPSINVSHKQQLAYQIRVSKWVSHVICWWHFVSRAMRKVCFYLHVGALALRWWRKLVRMRWRKREGGAVPWSFCSGLDRFAEKLPEVENCLF